MYSGVPEKDETKLVDRFDFAATYQSSYTAIQDTGPADQLTIESANIDAIKLCQQLPIVVSSNYSFRYKHIYQYFYLTDS